MEFQIEHVQSMKRAELQKLCKTFGIKANMKTAQLIEALLQHSAKEKSEKPVESIPDDECTDKEVAANEAMKATMEIKNSGDEKMTLSHVKDIEEMESEEQKSKLVAQKETKSSKDKSKIPRFTAVKSNKNPDHSTPSSNRNKTPCNIKNKTASDIKNKTPKPKDWKKIHQKEFDKMDSLGDYLDKKRKRAEELGCSVKKVKLLTQEGTTQKPAVAHNTPRCQSTVTPKSQQVKSVEKKMEFRRKTLTFNLSNAAKENAMTPGEFKRRATVSVTKPKLESAQKPTTPFRFSAAPNSFLSPTPRKVFDLKSSLAKPLSYKPYTGKLPTPPYAKQNANTVLVKKMKSHKRDVKAVKVTSRKERHDLQIKNQSKRRADGIQKCRGVC